ncbi:MAG: amino acid ABC transporter substrate-binding protein [Alphaproteobacteria bacterium]|nr:amino acid ABC transporter substrate-binding protein [Alphaproteobacteria bacterium]
MNKTFSLLASAIIAAVVAWGVGHFGAKGTVGQQGAAKESAFDRVLRTGTLRCGYADWPPYVFVKDPTTGKISGILPDVTEAIAQKLHLKVEWTENTGWGSYIESFHANRIDAFCAGLWRSAERGRYVGYVQPIFYSAVYPYVRIDDHRFDDDLSVINAPSVRISAQDGEQSDLIAKLHFPKATPVSVPQLGQISDILVNVAMRKADVVLTESSFANGYIKANPGTLRRAQEKPFEFFPTSLGVEIHETQLRDMLDTALIELQNQGLVEGIIAKYSNDPTAFLRVAKPYQ